jgi:hypothetical protein
MRSFKRSTEEAMKTIQRNSLAIIEPGIEWREKSNFVKTSRTFQFNRSNKRATDEGKDHV